MFTNLIAFKSVDVEQFSFYIYWKIEIQLRLSWNFLVSTMKHVYLLNNEDKKFSNRVAL